MSPPRWRASMARPLIVFCVACPNSSLCTLGKSLISSSLLSSRAHRALGMFGRANLLGLLRLVVNDNAVAGPVLLDLLGVGPTGGLVEKARQRHAPHEFNQLTAPLVLLALQTLHALSHAKGALPEVIAHARKEREHRVRRVKGRDVVVEQRVM